MSIFFLRICVIDHVFGRVTQDLERRDHFFSKTKTSVELLHDQAVKREVERLCSEEGLDLAEANSQALRSNSTKVMLVAHSMGAQV